MMNDGPIHLRQLPYFEPVAHTEDSVKVPVWITQSSLDGMHALIHYFEGVEKAGQGRVNGSFELIMFYRTIKSCLSSHKPNEEIAKDNDFEGQKTKLPLSYGLYKLYWKNGGHSLASVGGLHDGTLWYACTNWTNESTEGICSSDWDKVECVKKVLTE